MGRFTVDLDPHLLEEARRLSGLRSKRAVLEEALRAFVREKKREELARLAGSGLVDLTPEELEAFRSSWGDKGF
jgi:Arc/MetJ family transcription regulator